MVGQSKTYFKHEVALWTCVLQEDFDESAAFQRAKSKTNRLLQNCKYNERSFSKINSKTFSEVWLCHCISFQYLK